MSKDLLEALRENGLLDYGSHIPGDFVREALGIKYPEIGSKKEFDEIALKELGAVDYVRNAILNEGKYLAGMGSDYRILLPSENKEQIERYMSSAGRKLRRAGKLSRNTPPAVNKNHDNISARIMLKRESIRGASINHRQQIPGDKLSRPQSNPAQPIQP